MFFFEYPIPLIFWLACIDILIQIKSRDKLYTLKKLKLSIFNLLRKMSKKFNSYVKKAMKTEKSEAATLSITRSIILKIQNIFDTHIWCDLILSSCTLRRFHVMFIQLLVQVNCYPLRKKLATYETLKNKRKTRGTNYGNI